MELKKVEKIEQIIKENAPRLVGELLSNLECLNFTEADKLSFKQIKEIFKKLVREHIYQNSRLLIGLIRNELITGRIIFKEKPKTE